MSNRAKIVTVASQKGGVGKTVITSLLARYLTEVEGKNVIVIDLDSQGGITSLLWDKPITHLELSIVEVLKAAARYGDARDVFTSSLIKTGLEKSKHWQDNGGCLYLLPSKPSLDRIASENYLSLLHFVLHNLNFPKGHLILIDTGSDSRSVRAGINASDVVLLPLKYSKQDVHPTVETLRVIITAQQQYDRSILGGMIVNQAKDTQWEAKYQKRYQDLFDTFKDKTGLRCSTNNLFIHLKRSRVVQRGTYLDWSLRDRQRKTAQKMAAAVHAAPYI